VGLLSGEGNFEESQGLSMEKLAASKDALRDGHDCAKWGFEWGNLLRNRGGGLKGGNGFFLWM